ncbi:MAG: 50S ribosomal protein L11 methyltransferase [Caldimonas sp.]
MHTLTLLVPAPAVDAVCDRLCDELDALSASIEDADAGSENEQPVFDEPGLFVDAASAWQRARVSALFADEAGATAAATALVATRDEALSVESIAAVGEHDWVRLTQAQFGPSEISPGFWIVPTWSDVPAHARRVIRLDPGRAFGTGTHPTTRMCLRWIAEHGSAAGGGAGSRVLDYGCGSGVLAIAARVFGASHVDAVDIDPAAIEATRANALANGVAIDAGAPDDAAGPYRLVLANILAAPLKLLAPLLASLIDVGGHLVLSGVLSRHAAELRAAYAPWLDLEVAACDEGWILLVGRRAAAVRMA